MSFLFKSLSVILLFIMIFCTAAPARSQGQQIEQIEISQVDNSAFPTVTIYVRILDVNGEKVLDLTEDQFIITEDGQPVTISGFQSSNSEEITTLMMMDVSGSMNMDGKIGAARRSALTFVDLMRANDQLGLWLFNHTVWQSVNFTSDTTLLKSEIEKINANGGTAWHDAVIQASKTLQARSGRKSLLLLSDGQDEHSRSSFHDAFRAAEDAQTPVYAIGLGSGSQINSADLEKLAVDTGGQYYHAPDVAQLQSLYAAISRSTQEEYVFTYTSPRNSPDGTRRNINIEVAGVGGTTTYAEEHLLNIQSDLLVAVLAALPLLALLGGPSIVRGVGGAWKRRSTARKTPPLPNAAAALPYCGTCRGPLKPGARFCNTCGASQSGGQPVYQSAQPSPVAQPPVYVPPAQTPPAPPPVGQASVYSPPVQPPPPPVQPAAPKFCRQCGNPVRPGVRFCSKCGKSFD